MDVAGATTHFPFEGSKVVKIGQNWPAEFRPSFRHSGGLGGGFWGRGPPTISIPALRPIIARTADGPSPRAPRPLPRTIHIVRLAQLGWGNCTQCPAGFYCPSDSAVPLPCPDRYYSFGQADTCTICPAGYQCPDRMGRDLCPLGTYSPEGSMSCLTCPPGFGCETPFVDPVECPAGVSRAPGLHAPAQRCIPRIEGQPKGSMLCTTMFAACKHQQHKSRSIARLTHLVRLAQTSHRTHPNQHLWPVLIFGEPPHRPLKGLIPSPQRRRPSSQSNDGKRGVGTGFVASGLQSGFKTERRTGVDEQNGRTATKTHPQQHFASHLPNKTAQLNPNWRRSQCHCRRHL